MTEAQIRKALDAMVAVYGRPIPPVGSRVDNIYREGVAVEDSRARRARDALLRAL